MAAWTYWPLTGSSDIWDQNVVLEMDRQIALRLMAAGNPVWPPQSWPWATGVVGSMTATTMTDNNAPPKIWCGGTDDVSGISHNNPWSCADSEEAPSSWLLAVFHCDPTKSVVTPINSWTITQPVTVSYASLADYETSNQGVLADLAGCRYTIIRGDRGYASHQRIIQWNNDNERASGDVVSATIDGGTTTIVVRTPNGNGALKRARFRENSLVGSDLLVYAGGFLRRVSVTANASTSISYATQSWTPAAGALYIVLPPGGRGYPGRDKSAPRRWYAGYQSGYKTLIDDAVSSVNMPVPQVTIPGADNIGGCGGRDVRVWDYDFISAFPSDPFDLDCGAIGDKIYAPEYYVTWRARQQSLEIAAASHVRNSSHEGSKGITPLTAAGAFAAADINWSGTTSTTVEVSGADVTSNTLNHGSVDYPYYPIEVTWTLTDGTDNNYKSGYGLAVSPTQLVSHHVDLGSDTFAVATDESKSMTISWGWTRFQERMFRRIRPITGWVPSVDGDPPAAVDPASVLDAGTCFGVGRYSTRAASTHYLERAPQSQFAEVNNPDVKGFTIDGPDAIADGDLARFFGDDTFGPSIMDASAGFINAADPLADYYARFRTANSKAEYQRLIEADMKGTISSGTTTQFTCDDVNWWDHHWFSGNSNAHVETGTATSGSTTTLTDSGKAGTCYWKDARYDDGIYVNFPVEVKMSGASFTDPDAVIEKALVSAGTESGGLTFSPALSSSAGGKDYRIREPHSGIVSYLRGLPVRVSRRDPDTGEWETVDRVILGHDDKTAFVDALPWPATKDMKFEIVPPIIGGVYRRTSGAWVLASGADAERVSVDAPADFLRNAKANNPDTVVRYGRGVIGDSMADYDSLNELYRFALVLKRTLAYPSWTNDPTGSSPEENEKSNTAGNHSDWPNDGGWWDQMFACLIDGCDPTPSPWDTPSHNKLGWGSRTPTSSSGPPFAVSDGTGWWAESHTFLAVGNNSAGECSNGRRYAYAQVAVPQPFCAIGNKIEWYAYAGITAGDPDEGGTCIPGATSTDNNTWREYRFNGQGTSDGLIYRRWHTWDAETSYTTSEDVRTSASLGLTQLDPAPEAIAYPTPISCPSVLNTYGEMFPPRVTVTEGYYVLNVLAVVEWDF